MSARIMAWCAYKNRSCIHEEYTFLALFFLLLAPSMLLGDAGILIPRDKAQPDAAILSLEEMEITIRIDNGDARVFVSRFLPTTPAQSKKGTTFLRYPAGLRFPTLQCGTGQPAFLLWSWSETRRGDLQPAQSSRRSIQGFANGRTGIGRSQAQFRVQRTHRSYSALRNQAAGV